MSKKVSANTVILDSNLKMSNGAQMIYPRRMHYSALLKDRFIVVLGGCD